MAKRHYGEQPADKKRGMLMKEDWSEPALLPRGAHEVVAEPGMYMAKAGRATDLYYRVQETLREDAADMRSLTKPTNW
jgi:hypothetical protein